jgi:hypothetical protein
VVTFEDIKTFAFERLEAAKTLLEQDILFGHNFNKFGYDSGKVVDVLRQRKVGYSFIDSAENGFVNFKQKVLDVLLKDLLVRLFFVKRVSRRELE